MRERALRWVSVALTLAALIWSLVPLELSWARLARGVPQLGATLHQMFAPPDWATLPALLPELRTSLQIAALGTAIAAVLALPFGVLAARNLARLPALPFVGKLLLNLIRTFPELLLALAFIKAVGPGAFAGVMAVGVHSIGMIGKLYAERIETVDKGAREALVAAGASPLEVFRHAIVPEVLPDFLSFALYRFDLNVRSASVLGIVGAGGVGKLLILKIRGAKFPEVGMIVLAVIVTIAVVDYVSARLRARLT